MTAASVRQVQVTFDCADPACPGRVLERGARATSWTTRRRGSPPGTRRSSLGGARRSSATTGRRAIDPDGHGPRLFFQQVPEGKVAKNRVHLDVRAAPGLQGEARMAALEAECDAAGRARRDAGAAARARRPMSARPHRDARPGGQRVLSRLARTGEVVPLAKVLVRADVGLAFATERNRQVDDHCGTLTNVRRIVAEARGEGLLDGDDDDE